MSTLERLIQYRCVCPKLCWNALVVVVRDWTELQPRTFQALKPTGAVNPTSVEFPWNANNLPEDQARIQRVQSLVGLTIGKASPWLTKVFGFVSADEPRHELEAGFKLRASSQSMFRVL